MSEGRVVQGGMEAPHEVKVHLRSRPPFGHQVLMAGAGEGEDGGVLLIRQCQVPGRYY